MIFKLWHKLVLTMIVTTSVVLILALFISDHSVKKGFLSYINQVEGKRLDSLADILIEDYQEEYSWDFIRSQNDLWRRFSRQSRELSQPAIQADNTLPILHQLATREGEEESKNTDSLGEGQPRSEKPPQSLEFDGPRDDRPRRGEGKPPGSRGGPGGPGRRGDRKIRNPGRPLPPTLALLDKNQEAIVSSENITKEPSEENLKPLVLSGETIGFIQFEPFSNFTDDLDKQFLQYQNNAFLKVSLLALGLVLLGAAIFAAYLRARINKIDYHARLLTSGDFTPQELDTSKDEIGQLSHKLDVLGKTLKNNQRDRRRWVSDISHELRTPVAVLQGEIEAIQDGIREMNSDSVNSLHNETLRLSRLVTDLHQLSLSDSGALNYRKEQLNLTALIQGIISTHHSNFDEKNIDVSFETTTKDIQILADAQRLEQLFSNLANNSLHYTRESGKVDVNRNEGGSGLGLSICKNIVEAHDGTIIAQHSALGGINFMITFRTRST